MPVDVQPLPPAPAGFTGAVGRLALTAQVEPATLRMGEAATVTLTLAGEGNFQGVPDPELPEVAGLTVLPPQRDGEDRVANTVVRGTQTWTYSAVPERAGTYRLEVPAIPFFDPAERKYKAAAVPPIQLTALPAPAVVTVKHREAGMPGLARGDPPSAAVRKPGAAALAALATGWTARRTIRNTGSPRPRLRSGSPEERRGFRAGPGDEPGGAAPAGERASGGAGGGPAATGGGAHRGSLA